MDRFAGSCLCGDVQIAAIGRPYRVGLCHCLECRKHYGALFYAAAVLAQEAVTVSGETRDYAGRFFARSDDEIEIHLGSLDAADHLIPTYESGTAHRAAWLPAFGHTTSYTRDRKTTGQSET